jgi:hypothetical protein
MQKEYLKESTALTKHFVDHDISVLPLREIFKEYNVGQINFMKIDVEGLEYEVIVGNDWDKYRPEVLCIEANHIVKNWHPLMIKHNYHLIFFDGLNEYYVADECHNISKNFSYIQTILPKTLITKEVFVEIEKLKHQQRDQEQLILMLQKQQRDQEQLILMLQKQQRDVRFLAKRLYQEIQLRLNKRASTRRDNGDNLVYARDEVIRAKVNQPLNNKEEALNFIHKQDDHNIIRSHKQNFIKKNLKMIIWKVIAKMFSISSGIIKKVVGKIS